MKKAGRGAQKREVELTGDGIRRDVRGGSERCAEVACDAGRRGLSWKVM